MAFQQRMRLVSRIVGRSLAQAGEDDEGEVVLDVLRRIDVHVDDRRPTDIEQHTGSRERAAEALSNTRDKRRRCWVGARLPREDESRNWGLCGRTGSLLLDE